MRSPQITGIVDGRVTCVTDSPLLTSAHTPWSGFLLETHAAQVVKRDVSWGWHKTHVALFTKGALSFRARRAGHYRTRPGSVCIFPSGFDETRFSVAGADFESICVELDASQVKGLLWRQGPAEDGALAAQINVNDAHIAALLGTMRAEVEAGCQNGPLYGQSLSLALATHLLDRYSASRLGPVAVQRGFSKVQLRRVLEYIHAHLGTNIDLIGLSSAVQLSPRQFSRLFRDTFGMPPHRYIMRERIQQAVALLAGNRLSIVEIALLLGFANQSHFTDVFRRATGIPPMRFRREHCMSALQGARPEWEQE